MCTQINWPAPSALAIKIRKAFLYRLLTQMLLASKAAHICILFNQWVELKKWLSSPIQTFKVNGGIMIAGRYTGHQNTLIRADGYNLRCWLIDKGPIGPAHAWIEICLLNPDKFQSMYGRLNCPSTAISFPTYIHKEKSYFESIQDSYILTKALMKCVGFCSYSVNR